MDQSCCTVETSALTGHFAVSHVDRLRSRIGYLRLALQDLTSRCTSASSLNGKANCLGHRSLSTGLKKKSWPRLSSALALSEFSETVDSTSSTDLHQAYQG